MFSVSRNGTAYIPIILSQRRFGDVSDPVKIMAAYSTAPGYGQAIAVLSIICYILLLIWVFALHERMKADAPYLTRAMLIAMSAAATAYIAWAVVWIKGIGIIVPSGEISSCIANTSSIFRSYCSGNRRGH
jgi:hypothetical protein